MYLVSCQYLALMELATHLELHSQATRLEERALYDSAL